MNGTLQENIEHPGETERRKNIESVALKTSVRTCAVVPKVTAHTAMLSLWSAGISSLSSISVAMLQEEEEEEDEDEEEDEEETKAKGSS